jgi:hypothetical protein
MRTIGVLRFYYETWPESVWLCVMPATREFAEKCDKKLPGDGAPKSSLLEQAAAANILREIRNRSSIYISDLLHH